MRRRPIPIRRLCTRFAMTRKPRDKSLNRSSLVYLIGVALLGFFYRQLGDLFDRDWQFVAVVICYLLALRGIAALLNKWVSLHEER